MASRSQGGKGNRAAASRRRAGRGTRSVPTTVDAAPRIRWIIIVFALAVAVIAVRLVYLTLIVGPENAEKGEAARTQTITVSAKRGTIYDVSGTVLAIDVEATTVYCNPYEVTDPSGEAKQIAAVLGGEAEDYLEALVYPDVAFAYIYRKADVDDAALLESLDLDGIYFLEETKREYPCGEVAGQVVGICDVDGNGLSGLELYYDELLGGTDGVMETERGANGMPVAGGVRERTPGVEGSDIVVSIDVEMQTYLQERLVQIQEQLGGASANAVLYDGATGEIVACASTPYLNPNERESVEEGATELKSITTAFEPGSIFKTVSMTAIMEEGVLATTDEIFCPAELPADEYYISDAHSRSDITYTVKEILEYSSNVGMSLAAETLGFDKLYNYINTYNLTSLTGVDYPGESSGYCSDVTNWTQVQCYNVSFGQGVSVTPLQMARFYGALANDGVECTPHFLVSSAEGGTAEYATKQVIQNTDAIAQVTDMLCGVVEEGTGTGARIDGYDVAGKTGTAEMVGDDGLYLDGVYNISFIGYLPNTNSSLVCFVGVTEVPADAVTTSAFKDIMTLAIEHYGISVQ